MKSKATPVLLGFYLGLHDSNVCAWIDGGLKYRKFERHSGIKHQRATIADVIQCCEQWDIAPDFVAFSDGGRNALGSCRVDELARRVPPLSAWAKADQTYCLDHHYAHVLSAAGQVPNGLVRGIAIDGSGDNGIRVRAVAIDGAEAVSLFHSKDFALGRFFTKVGMFMGLAGDQIDLAGKVMGAQAFGRIDEDFVNACQCEEPEGLPRRLLEDIRWRGQLLSNDPSFFSVTNSSFLDWLASAHKVLEQALGRIFVRIAGRSGPLIYSGGCAQNAVFNEALFRAYPELVVPPHPYDGGLSVGCVEFLRRMQGMAAPQWCGFPFVQDDGDVGQASDVTCQEVAELLARGKIVGWMQGRGEIGPRSLGHRSILFDARRADGKSLLNERVKRREPWRPYAASVLAQEAPNWFQTADSSPFMLRAIPTRTERLEAIPAVVHQDSTCRIQTVDEENPELRSFCATIRHLNNATGVPLVLNTSLNGAGEPIYGSESQARRLLRSGRLDALCIGDRLISN